MCTVGHSLTFNEISLRIILAPLHKQALFYFLLYFSESVLMQQQTLFFLAPLKKWSVERNSFFFYQRATVFYHPLEEDLAR